MTSTECRLNCSDTGGRMISKRLVVEKESQRLTLILGSLNQLH